MKKIIALVSLIVLISGTGSFAQSTNETGSMNPKEKAEAYYSQGYLYYLEGNYKDAGPEFVKALNVDPKMSKAYYWLAKTDYKTGKYKQAVANCDAALAIDTGYNAAKILRKEALAKIPYSKPANTEAPKAVVTTTPAPASAGVASQPKAKKKNLITLDLRNVDISSVLQIFSNETGMDIIAGKDVYGKVTVIINNMDPDQALDMILKSNGYVYIKDGNVVRVFSSGEPARIEELPDGTFVRTFIINYVGPDELRDTMLKLMPSGSSVYTTKGSNTVIVKGTANDIKRAEVIIRNLDIPPKQVMVEAKIVEVSVTENQKLGVNYAKSTINPDGSIATGQTVNFADSPTAVGATGLYYTVTNTDMTSLVSALSTRTGFNILSSPKVIALNNQKAEIITGSRLGYKIKTVTTTGMVESVEFLDVGTKLVITPSIKSDGQIVMEIHPEISEGSIINDLPQKNSTETTTKLIVKDGQTIVIGGLIRDTSKKEVKGVPILMDIPLIGMAFKGTSLTSEKKEVVVLITPHIYNAKLESEMDRKSAEILGKKKDLAPVMPLDLAR